MHHNCRTWLLLLRTADRGCGPGNWPRRHRSCVRPPARKRCRRLVVPPRAAQDLHRAPLAGDAPHRLCARVAVPAAVVLPAGGVGEEDGRALRTRPALGQAHLLRLQFLSWRPGNWRGSARARTLTLPPGRLVPLLQSWAEHNPMPWIASAAAVHWGSVCVVKSLQILLAAGAGMKTKGVVVPLYASPSGTTCIHLFISAHRGCCGVMRPGSLCVAGSYYLASVITCWSSVFLLGQLPRNQPALLAPAPFGACPLLTLQARLRGARAPQRRPAPTASCGGCGSW